MTLTFQCPSCTAKLANVEASASATQVVTRTCRACRERWQLVVAPTKARGWINLTKADFTFLGRRPRQKGGA